MSPDQQRLERPLTRNVRPDRAPTDLAAYEANGGYRALRKVMGNMSPGECLQIIKDSNLRGRGRAGFPTGTNTESEMPTRWSRAPSRTACCWSAIRTS